MQTVERACVSGTYTYPLEVAEQDDYLGGDPTVEVKNAEYSQDSKKMLEIDLLQEQETIKNAGREYVRLKDQANSLSLKR